MPSVVIVESPAKARTLEKFLGKNFRVLASYGHVRDLPKKGLGVDRGHSYEPTYEVLHGKEKTLLELKRAAQKADAVYLAADPDREGEAISWHLKETLSPGAKDKPFRRVRFNEITKKAVLAAMDNAGEIDSRLVDAQQARRIIDRLVGYEVSDLLWKKIWRGLSAGRVQTVALRIICEREKEIEGFVPVEYWTVDADLEAAEPPAFTAKLVSFDGQKLKFDGTDPR
ncbi:MAG TPA: DNA topoisomerase, partial [Thermoanaerobaculia bacterium]|nr:DNA topoisomerase [Thermoanaerobaculia bacterium]